MRIIPVLLLLTWAFIAEVSGQATKSLFDTLFALEQVKITLIYPFDSLYRTNREEIDAIITIESKDGPLIHNEKMSINLRGKFRRMKCTMPPLLLNFKKSTLRNLNLNTIDEIKLVTHCLETPEGQDNLQEERLCYQIYESLTPYAYRSIWVDVEYIDLAHPKKRIISNGFLLEPDKDITNRLGIEERKLFNVSADSLHYETYANAVAFNFLIGNRDWSIVMSRNAKLFFNPTIGKYNVIPYDFDYSNIVGASYRRETRPEKMTHTFDRLYQGEYFIPRSGEILKTFHANEARILEKVSSVPNPMDEAKRKKIARYFESWFDYIDKSSAKDLHYGMVMPYKGGL
jgi:hypothetical protein